jgi:hypothetical protein
VSEWAGHPPLLLSLTSEGRGEGRGLPGVRARVGGLRGAGLATRGVAAVVLAASNGGQRGGGREQD